MVSNVPVVVPTVAFGGCRVHPMFLEPPLPLGANHDAMPWRCRNAKCDRMLQCTLAYMILYVFWLVQSVNCIKATKTGVLQNLFSWFGPGLGDLELLMPGCWHGLRSLAMERTVL